jgi:hypothetical protein
MSSFALANDANVDIFMTEYDCYLHSFEMKSQKYGILNVMCKSRVGLRLGRLPMVRRIFALQTLQFQKMAVRREFPCRAGIGQFRPDRCFVEG